MSITIERPNAGVSKNAGARLREKMEDAVQRLLDALDALEDTDADSQADDVGIDELEGGREGDIADDEPLLGSIEAHPQGYFSLAEKMGWTDQRMWSAGVTDGREGDDADAPEGEAVDEDGDGDPDREPSLGWPENGKGNGSTNDREMPD